MKKKVYLVINHSVTELEDSGIGTSLFENYSDAKFLFDELVANEKDYIDETWEIEETEDTFEAWIQGMFSENHSIVQIRDIVIE